MVALVRAGAPLRAVARHFDVSLYTVQWWVKRAGTTRLERVDWSTHPPVPRGTRRTARSVEELVLNVRQELRQHSALGEYGAAAIHRTLCERGEGAVPSVRTIGRILVRCGALDGQRRVRRPAPPRGWYLPAVGRGAAEADCFDIVEGLVLQGAGGVEVLNVVSLHGGLADSWPTTMVSAKLAVDLLLAHWRTVGVPSYAQFDNDTIFQGAHQHRDSISRVMRLCLSLGIVPVFAPPREPGFQAAIESFNGRWQAKVWARFHHDSLEILRERSARYILALRQRRALRIDAAPARRPFPTNWQLDLQAHPHGLLIYIRRTSELGTVSLLGRSFLVDRQWTHRLVRCEVHLDAGLIRCYALRRRGPDQQPLLATLPYALPHRRFDE
jgi:hypothetical protein